MTTATVTGVGTGLNWRPTAAPLPSNSPDITLLGTRTIRFANPGTFQVSFTTETNTSADPGTALDSETFYMAGTVGAPTITQWMFDPASTTLSNEFLSSAVNAISIWVVVVTNPGTEIELTPIANSIPNSYGWPCFLALAGGTQLSATVAVYQIPA